MDGSNLGSSTGLAFVVSCLLGLISHEFAKNYPIAKLVEAAIDRRPQDL
jgi:hypothetical protein